jgi:hypothetical protein
VIFSDVNIPFYYQVIQIAFGHLPLEIRIMSQKITGRMLVPAIKREK